MPVARVQFCRDLVVGELVAGTFSFAGFYLRRARRILPALYATVEQRTGQPTDLRVRSFNDAGVLTDPGAGSGFHVAVFCP